MSYPKHTWEHLERVTTEKMNNMEEGIAAADSAAAQAQEVAEEALSGSLPTPTSADVGKVATVVEETSKGAVIVPPQTPVDNTLSNGNPSLFTIGETVIVTIDGTDYSCVVEEGKDELIAAAHGFGTVTYDEIGGFMFSGEATIVAVYAVSASASWQPAAPSGGVLVVTESSNKLSESFNTIKAALLAGKTVQLQSGSGGNANVVGMIYGCENADDGTGAEIFMVGGFRFIGNPNPENIMWETYNPSTASLTRYNG